MMAQGPPPFVRKAEPRPVTPEGVKLDGKFYSWQHAHSPYHQSASACLLQRHKQEADGLHLRSTGLHIMLPCLCNAGFMMLEAGDEDLPEHVVAAKLSHRNIDSVEAPDMSYFPALKMLDLSDNRVRDRKRATLRVELHFFIQSSSPLQRSADCETDAHPTASALNHAGARAGGSGGAAGLAAAQPGIQPSAQHRQLGGGGGVPRAANTGPHLQLA